jgi:hypothetical protein
MGKQMFYRQLEMGLDGRLPAGLGNHGLQHDGRRCPEGIDAFIQKRKPEWKG